MSRLFPQPEYEPPIRSVTLGDAVGYRIRGDYNSVLATFSRSQAVTPWMNRNTIVTNWYGMRLV